VGEGGPGGPTASTAAALHEPMAVQDGVHRADGWAPQRPTAPRAAFRESSAPPSRGSPA
jgi:hypothetical protein